jgi:AraC family transcriptional regulator
VTQPPDWLLPVLVRIQASLDGDLRLAVLSRWARLSPSHFHRTFRADVGETPADYVARVRLERAAFRLQIQETSVLEIALDSGYRNHETFTRAFRRAFGRAPGAYRAWQRQRMMQTREPAQAEPAPESAYAISATKVARLRQMHLAFVRHVGPYEKVPDTLFGELDAWARRRRVAGPRIWLGIGHDAPGTTPPAQLRFDAALVIPEVIEQDGRVGCQTLPECEFAVTTHVGPYSSLPAAYAEIFQRVLRLKTHILIGLPAVEIYRTVKVNARLRLNETDVCLPVQRRTGRR